jgi:hypothetical protein
VVVMSVAGLRGTGDWGTDERPKNFRETILFRNPSGSAPIFALTSKAGKVTVDDPEFAWWDEPNDLVRLQVNGALAASDTLVTVDSLDPTSASATASARLYGKATNLKEGDLLLVEPSADSSSFTQELLTVTQVLSDTQFTVARGQGGTSAAGISNDAYLLLLGSAYAEGTGVPRATIRNPIKYSNYTQIFKDTYELTGTADATRTRTGPAWSNDKKRKMFKHAADIELSILMGRPYETTGENGKPKRFMGGLRNYVGNVTVFGTAVTPSTFFDAIGPIWDFDTGAGDTRIAFAGRYALQELQKVFESKFTRMVTGGVTKVYGMDLTEFVTQDGRLLVRTHPLMSRHPLYKKSMYVLDFDSLKYVALKGRDTAQKDDVQAKDEDVRRGFLQTECSIRVDRGGLTMAYLGNISST